MDDRGTGRVAVVTGGSQGLGLALAEALVRAGWSVVIDARRQRRLTSAADRLGEASSVAAIVGDITDPRHRASVADAAAKLGPVTLVVNNASTLGATPLEAVLDLDPAVFRRTFDVNVVAPFTLISALEPHLAPGATVINVTSDAAAEPYAHWGGYGASKAALEPRVEIFALERPDFRVLVVDPGDMRTEMHADAFAGEDISDRPEPSASVPGIMALIEGDQPSGRYVARAIASADRAVG